MIPSKRIGFRENVTEYEIKEEFCFEYSFHRLLAQRSQISEAPLKPVIQDLVDIYDEIKFKFKKMLKDHTNNFAPIIKYDVNYDDQRSTRNP